MPAIGAESVFWILDKVSCFLLMGGSLRVQGEVAEGVRWGLGVVY